MKIKSGAALAFMAGVLFFAGCETRSISNSGFDHRRDAGRIGGYSGELSELQVLGVAADKSITEADIQAALQSGNRARLTRTSKILLIQSGADFPDAPMFDAMSDRFSVAPFSGRPPVDKDVEASYSKSLRLAAARGGYDKIVCYWGVLESEKKDQVTRAVSWVPIVGYAVPDQRENMRIRLKAAIVDVASGRWSLVTPPTAASSDISSIYSRRSTDQSLVAALKETGYRNLAHTLANDFVE